MKQQIAQWLTGGAAWWILSIVLGQMPAPKENSSVAYIWLHNIAQAVAANPYRIGKKDPTQ